MRFLMVSLMVTTTMVVMPGVTADAAGEACREPIATYRYSTTEMRYELTVDYEGCSWWQGSSAILEGFLESRQAGGLVSTRRFDTTGVAFCEPGGRFTTCSLAMTLAHDATEVAQYSGRITYPWQDARRAQEFAVTCLSVAQEARCRADP